MYVVIQQKPMLSARLDDDYYNIKEINDYYDINKITNIKTVEIRLECSVTWNYHTARVEVLIQDKRC